MNQKKLFTFAFLSIFFANSFGSPLQAFFVSLKTLMTLTIIFYILYYSYKYKQNRVIRSSRKVFFLILVFSLLSVSSLLLQGFYGNPQLPDPNYRYSFAYIVGFMLISYFGLQLSKFLKIRVNRNNFIEALTASAAVVVFSNLLLFFLGINLGRGAVGGRFSGWFDNPNTLGLVLLGVFPFVFIGMIEAQQKKKIYYVVLLCSLVVIALATGSRATAVGILIMTSVLMWGRSDLWKSVAVVLGFLASVLVLLGHESSVVANFFPQFLRESDDVLSGRSGSWVVGWKFFLDRPLFGYGVGMEEHIIAKFVPEWANHQGKHFHNSYLSLLISNGLIGTLIILYILVGALKKALGTIFSSGRVVENTSINLLMSTLFVGFLFNAYFETWLFSPGSTYGFIFWTSCFWLLSIEDGKKRT